MLKVIFFAILAAFGTAAAVSSPAVPEARSEAAEADSAAYLALATKAERMFHYREWQSAAALYGMMIERRPHLADSYGHAIVAAGMTGDTLQQISLSRYAFSSHVPFDSLFQAVERVSFSIGQTSLYERYLIIVRSHQPWFARAIDAYLLRYYTFRRDAPGMIAYSLRMLDHVPYNLQFLYSLAQGYLFDGQADRAIETYLKIVSIDPTSTDALLYLANYYYDRRGAAPANADKALAYFRQAQSRKPTPYIDSRIAELTK
jgi:hypothetical protein